MCGPLKPVQAFYELQHAHKLGVWVAAGPLTSTQQVVVSCEICESRSFLADGLQDATFTLADTSTKIAFHCTVTLSCNRCCSGWMRNT